MFKSQGILPTPFLFHMHIIYQNLKLIIIIFPIILGYITEKMSMHCNNYTNTIITNNLCIYIYIYSRPSLIRISLIRTLANPNSKKVALMIFMVN